MTSVRQDQRGKWRTVNSFGVHEAKVALVRVKGDDDGAAGPHLRERERERRAGHHKGLQPSASTQLPMESQVRVQIGYLACGPGWLNAAAQLISVTGPMAEAGPLGQGYGVVFLTMNTRRLVHARPAVPPSIWAAWLSNPYLIFNARVQAARGDVG